MRPPSLRRCDLSNAPAATPLQELAEHQGQRHFIERTFQNSKSHLGMADYQVRKWQAWHRHMAMVALAGRLFVMEERMFNRKERPLLSTRDVAQLGFDRWRVSVYSPRLSHEGANRSHPK